MELENTFNVEISPEESLEIYTIKDACNILYKSWSKLIIFLSLFRLLLINYFNVIYILISI